MARPRTPPRLLKGREKPRHRYFASTPRGLEEVLLAELQALGLEECRSVPGGAYFEGPLDACYRANLWLRSAVRVLRIVAEFPCRDERELYEQVWKLPWHQHMAVEQTLAVRARLGRTPIGHSHYAALKIKDAIVDRFRADFRSRPNIDARQPDIQVHAWIDDERCTLGVDGSGWPLFMRGYRAEEGAAPLKENLAAGLIALTGWHGERPFYDPMCGSGTLPIEAALIAGRRAPGLLRGRFGFQSWPDFHAAEWKAIQAEARAAARPIAVPIMAADRDAAAVRQARQNAGHAGVADAIAFSTAPIESFQPLPQGGLLLINPPYGERLERNAGLAPLYKRLGDILKHRCTGMDAYIFTLHGELAKAIGLRPSRRHILFNGPLECRLLRYQMY
ncbi:MAG: RNA methyltransferase [Candidatus Lambdaproteobacteria bacterium]|nr:RNA methyltransferase [Candidatus Lambdaproteobacteria bacterium]